MRTWIVLRAAGIGAYLALFLSVAWGLLATTSLVTRRVSKPAATLFHASTGAAGLALLGLHMALLLVDRFEPFHLLDLLVPWRSTFRPTAIAVGIVSMYATVAIVVTSRLRTRISTSWWRRTHLAAVPAFALALLHGVLAGTDTGRPWMFWLYAGTGLLVVFLVLVRSLTVGFRPPRPAPPATRATSEPGRTREPVSAA